MLSWRIPRHDDEEEGPATRRPRTDPHEGVRYLSDVIGFVSTTGWNRDRHANAPPTALLSDRRARELCADRKYSMLERTLRQAENTVTRVAAWTEACPCNLEYVHTLVESERYEHMIFVVRFVGAESDGLVDDRVADTGVTRVYVAAIVKLPEHVNTQHYYFEN